MQPAMILNSARKIGVMWSIIVYLIKAGSFLIVNFFQHHPQIVHLLH